MVKEKNSLIVLLQTNALEDEGEITISSKINLDTVPVVKII